MTENNLNLESICRTYSLVEAKEDPYNEKLSKIKTSIESSYKFISFEEEGKKIKEVLGELEEISLSKNGFLDIFKKIINRNNGLNSEEVIKSGNNIIKSREKLNSLQNMINQGYNTCSEAVYGIAQGIKGLELFIEKSEKDMKDVSGNIISLYNLHNNKEQLREYIIELVEKNEETKKLQGDEKEKLVSNLINKGEEEIKILSKSYLELKNDISISRKLISHKSLVDKYNNLAESFEVAKERINKEIEKVLEILMHYEMITAKQISFLEQIKLPENYISSLNILVSNFENVDETFSDKLLKTVFNSSVNPEIQEPGISKITYGLIKHLRENGGKPENER